MIARRYFSTRDPMAALPVLRAALRYFDANCGHDRWFRIGAVIYTETDGSGEGLALFDSWSSRSRSKYPGRRGIERQWGYYGKHRGRPITMGTLIRLLDEEGVSWETVKREADKEGRE